MTKRRQREYLLLFDKANAAVETAIDSYNRVRHPYRNETTLILLANAWELLGKAILLHTKQSISAGKKGDTISAEIAISRLQHHKGIEEHEANTVQQIVSLRHAATHHFLPEVPDEVMQHLLFYACKFFREVAQRHFKNRANILNQNFLSLSFANLTTYADKVQRLVARVKKSDSDKKLVWLLERGVAFDGTSYMTEKQFEAKYRNKGKVMPYLALSDFLKQADMVRIVPVEAPKNYTADISLRKGNMKDVSLPVIVKKTELEKDYPYLTKELGEKIGRTMNWAAKAVADLRLKGDPKYHQSIRASKTSEIHRYSEAAFSFLQNKLKENPNYDPFHRAPAP